MKKVRYAHIFTESSWSGPIAVYGKTPDDFEKVRDHIGSQYTDTAVYSHTEERPYALAPIVADILPHLPGNWDAEPIGDEHEESGFDLIRDDGLCLYISGPCYRAPAHYSVSFSWPVNPVDGRRIYEVRDENHKKFSPESARVSVKKTGEQIAKDIARRVLPSAEIAHRLCLETIARNLESKSVRDSALARVCETMGLPIPSNPHVSRDSDTNYQVSTPDYDRVTVNYSGNVSIDFRSLPLEKALQVLALFRRA